MHPSLPGGSWRLSSCHGSRVRFYSHHFLATKPNGGFHRIFNLSGLNTYARVLKFRMETLNFIIRVFTKVGGWCRWISMIPFACADSFVPLALPPVCSQESGGRSHWLSMEGSPVALATLPRVFTKLLAPVVAYLHLQGCLIYSYIDDIFHAQTSFHQACCTHDISLRYHFMLGFTLNLKKPSLIPSQVIST